MAGKTKNEATDRLFEAILKLETLEECYAFFEDLCTVTELQSFAQRLDVAFMLDKGKTYIEITEQTKASTATISRVNRSLNYGNEGYKLVIERLSNSIDS